MSMAETSNQMSIPQRLSNLISWVLVADLGVVLLSLGWFLVAVLGRSMNLDLGLDLWYSALSAGSASGLTLKPTAPTLRLALPEPLGP